MRRLEGNQRARPDERVHVKAQLSFDRVSPTDAARSAGGPAFGVLLEGGAGGFGVDVVAAFHVGLGLGEPGFGEALLSIGEALGLLGSVRADVTGAVPHACSVAVGLDCDGLAIGGGDGLVPAVLDMPCHGWRLLEGMAAAGGEQVCSPPAVVV